MQIQINKNPGLHVTLFYLALHILFPFTIYSLGFNEYGIYEYVPPSFSLLIYIFSTFIFFLLLHSLYMNSMLKKTDIELKSCKEFFNLYLRLRPIWAYVLFIICAYLYLEGAQEYRYSNEGISESGLFGFAVVFLKPFLFFELFLCTFYPTIFNSQDSFIKNLFVAVPFLLSYLFLVSGTTEAMIFLIAFFSFIANKQFNKLFFNSMKTVFNFFMRYLFIFASILIFFPLALFYGESIKQSFSVISFDFVTFALQYVDFQSFLSYLAARFSTHYFSLLYALNYYSTIDISLMSIPLNTFLDRFNILMGMPFQISAEEFNSLAKLNYHELTIFPFDDRQGTSPGILATWVYSSGMILSTFLSALNLVFIVFLIDKLFSKFTEIKIALPGIFVIYLFFSFLYESPLDLMIIIDNAFIMLFLLIVFAFSGREISEARS